MSCLRSHATSLFPGFDVHHFRSETDGILVAEVRLLRTGRFNKIITESRTVVQTRQFRASVQGSTMSTPDPSKSRTLRVIRMAARERDIAAI